MAKGLPAIITKLMDEFGKMPGIGVHSAQRLAFYVLQAPIKDIDDLSESIKQVKTTFRITSLGQ